MKKHRLTIELDDKTYKELKELQEKMGETSKTGLFRTSIALLEGIAEDIFVKKKTLGIIEGGKIVKEILIT